MESSEAAPGPPNVREHLREGQVIPAHPLALTADRSLDDARQRGLTRYYVDSGAGGVAVGVHTTQFAIRDSAIGLYRPVLELAMDEARTVRATRPFAMIAGVCGHTAQARSEAELAAAIGYDASLLSLGDWRTESEEELLDHCRVLGEIMPLFGFYLQTAVGGRVLSHRFWREFVEIANVWAIKIAPFNRYQTIDVVRAVVESGRDDIALYTGNDDNIVADLLTPFPVHVGGATVVRWIDGGLLGQWAVWTEEAVAMLAAIKAARAGGGIDSALLSYGAALTDANGAIFDAANRFAGCIPGIHEVLRRDGLLDGIRCLDPQETLSPGQDEEITRAIRALESVRGVGADGT
ncbi:MAG TPA: dihydrodipicolinate synthase family protein [Gemmatimonadaceae bacterium]|jgi:dihydrodipicolinate synthase/N-acetylneuraminate lyase|nr:dihydrodipicolinate synthase family protein [Gemmatimonadaceae bacterium]